MRRVLRVVAFATAVLLCCEVLLRLHARLMNPAAERVEVVMMRRLWPLWTADAPPNPLSPPFAVFANRGFDDEERMARIRLQARLPPGGSWTETDFLQSPESGSASAFTVRINSLGFRDPERSPRKPPGTFRIICLGAYQTFGHGVSDQDTFPRRLETLLNDGGGRPRYEVWNGGKQSATAIMGLARLRSEIADYAPDLLVLEYGFADRVVWGDNWRVLPLMLPAGPPALRPVRKLFRLLACAALVRSYVVHRSISWLQGRHEPTALRQWEEAMRRMLDLARDRGLPVIMIDRAHGPSLEPVFRRLASAYPRARFVSVPEAFLAHPPSAEQEALFARGGNWTTEFDGRPFGRPYAPYYVDYYQLNGRGLDVVARALLPHARAAARKAF